MKKISIGFLLTLFLVCMQASSWAQVLDDGYTVIAPLRGSDAKLYPGAMNEVKDIYYYLSVTSGTVKMDSAKIRNLVVFKINEQSPRLVKKPFTAHLVYRLYFTDLNGYQDSTATDQVLDLSYDTTQGSAYQVAKSIVFSSQYDVKLKVISITTQASGWNPLPVLEVDNIMQYRHYFHLDCANSDGSTALNVDGPNDPTSPDELAVRWFNVQGADAYDLEWTYIDSSAYTSRKYGDPAATGFADKVFRNNATRVSLSELAYFYNIPLLYDNHGWLLCRIRSVKLDPNNNQRRVEGNWSSLVTYEFMGHQRNLNWQASTGFAEEGKRKSVVQYFDGTLRNRQTVTKDNSTATTIVAETMYDYQGRPTIQVLPSPTLHTLIGYTPLFNQSGNLNSPEYDKDHFDKALLPGMAVCGLGADSMSSRSGASQYYSSANPNTGNAFNKYIPDAQRFPFSQVQYTQDNSGRIAAQGGVGPVHQVGSGHETKYYYGTPDQNELNALFGTEAGYASHYFKNMVRDANGQYSVSYADMQGRTIATALAGQSPANTNPLPSYANRSVTKKLTDANNNIIKGYSIESGKSLVVTRSGSNLFSYSLTPDSLSLNDCNSGQPVCYGCLYSLQITVTDDCNNSKLPNGQPFVFTDSNFTAGAYPVDCTKPAPAFNRIDTFSLNLSEGVYTVTKKLTVSKPAMDYYRDSIFAAHSTCITLDTLLRQQSDGFTLQHPSCMTDCGACRTLLGSYTAFRTNYMIQNGLDSNAIYYNIEQRIRSNYNQQLANCDLICGKTSNYIDQVRAQMLQDMTPPYGQYASDTQGTDPWSIFTANGTSSATYRQIYYRSIDGTPDYVYVNGTWVTPGQLSATDFIANFRPYWAALLLPYHPEYSRLQALYTQVSKASYDWDEDFSNTQTYSQAQQKGYLNPTGNYSFVNRFSNISFPVNPSPALTDSSVILNGNISAGLNNYLQHAALNAAGTDSISLWSLASARAYCNGAVDAACLNANTANPFPDTSNNGLADMAWVMFRNLYQAKKTSYISDYLAQVASNASQGYPDFTAGVHTSQFVFDVGSTLTNNIGLTDPLNVSGAMLGPNLTVIKEKIGQQYIGNCQGYAQSFWWNQLAPCTTAKLLPDSAAIMLHLINVCSKGSDALHPFGSSAIATDSNYQFRNFDEVIAYYVAKYNSTHTDSIRAQDCNGYLITYPAAKPLPLSSQPVVTRPDSCTCTTLNNLYAQYQYAPIDASFSAYIKRTQGADMSQGSLDTLMAMCRGTLNVNLIAHPIQLPPALQCAQKDICVTCAEVRMVYDSFGVRYPAIIPSYLDNDSTHNANQLFASYMNNKLGFGKQASEYLQFIDSCQAYRQWPASGGECMPGTAPDTLVVSQRSGNTPAVYTARRAVIFLPGFSSGATDQFTTNIDSTLRPCVPVGGPVILPPPGTNADTSTCIVNVPANFYQANGTTSLCRSYFQNAAYALEGAFIYASPVSPDSTAVEIEDTTGYWRNLNNTTTGKLNRCGVWVCDSTSGGPFGQWVGFTEQVYVPKSDTVFVGMGADNEMQVSIDGTPFVSLLQQYSIDNRPFIRWHLYPVYLTQGVHSFVVQGRNTDMGASFGLELYGTNRQTLLTADSTVINQKVLFTTASIGRDSAGYSCAGSVTTINTGGGYACAEKQPCNKTCTYTIPANFYQSEGNSFCVSKFRHGAYTLEGAFVYGSTWMADSTAVEIEDSTGYWRNLGNLTTGKLNNVGVWLCNSTAGEPFNQWIGFTEQVYVPKTDTVFIGMAGDNEMQVSIDGQPFKSLLLKDWADMSEFIRWHIYPVYLTRGVHSLRVQGRNANDIGSFGLELYNLRRDQLFTADSATINRSILFSTADITAATAAGGYSCASGQAAQQVGGAYACKETAPCSVDMSCESLQGILQSFARTYNVAAQGGDCQSSFTQYFNNVESVNFSYNQIQSLYLQTCGSFLNACPTKADLYLCGRSQPVFAPVVLKEDSLCSGKPQYVITHATELYRLYKDSLMKGFDSLYLAKCLGAISHESFTVTQSVSEYHYTLYYYDQAGNLVKTVPPAGVNANYDAGWLQSVDAARAAGSSIIPTHSMVTQYRYNSLGQVAAQNTPDGGNSNYWYDRLGRLAVSQNAKQLAEGGNYSYTKYDSLGRITEVGQINAGGSMSDSLSRTPDQLQNWFAGNTNSREQITTTVYDLPSKDVPGGKDISAYMQQPQGNTRGRVSFTTFTQANNPVNYDQATYYSYDAHGNVQHLLQDYGSSSVMGINGHQYKRVDYDYDLVSGKVNKVSYQAGRPDAFYHLYKYDAENRITDVYTSKDSLLWDHEAWYQYYKHGPLARTELGANRVQGITYAYTLQGWLKSINPVEGDISNAAVMPRPAYNVRLNYYDGDYQAINPAVTPAGVAGQLGNLYRPLYNGNINSMVVNIGKLQSPLLYGYQYDQLNRLAQMDAWQASDSSFRSLSLLDKYHEGITYDANGNIDRYQRKGNNSASPVMDQLSYHYQPGTNKLNYIEDAIPDNAYPNDIDNQQAGNYSYDAIGNLVSDAKEGINSIRWTVYGKIAGISKGDGTSISYGYDAGGHRISKTVNGRTDWYVRDASGNVLSVYTVSDNSINGGHFTQKELSLYGSSRLGILNLQRDLTAGAPISYNLGTVLQADSSSSLLRGRKLFELGNHLGNVLATVSDKTIPHSSNDSTVDSYSADVVSAQDYYPFGMLMPGRSYSSSTPYRYGFNGKENDNEVKGEGNSQDYGMRVYDPRVGRFLSVDLLTKNYPWYTPYQFAGNSPISKSDLDGKEPQDFKEKWTYQPLFDLKTGGMLKGTGTKIYVTDSKLGGGQIDAQLVYDEVTKQNWFIHQDGNKFYYLKNADGNNSVMTINPKTYEVKGGNFVEFETQNQIQAKLGVELATAMEKAVFGMAAIGAALPALGAASATGTFIGKGVASAGYDAISQLATNGFDAGNINLTEVGASFFIQGTAVKALFAKNAIGNFGRFEGKYKGVGSEGYATSDALSDLLKSGIGTGFDLGFEKLKNLPVGNKAQLGRWQNLSHKNKYAEMLRTSQRNAAVNNLFNSGSGSLTTGALSGAAVNSVHNNDDKK